MENTNNAANSSFKSTSVEDVFSQINDLVEQTNDFFDEQTQEAISSASDAGKANPTNEEWEKSLLDAKRLPAIMTAQKDFKDKSAAATTAFAAALEELKSNFTTEINGLVTDSKASIKLVEMDHDLPEPEVDINVDDLNIELDEEELANLAEASVANDDGEGSSKVVDFVPNADSDDDAVEATPVEDKSEKKRWGFGGGGASN